MNASPTPEVSAVSATDYTPRADRTQAVLDELRQLAQPVELSSSELAALVGCHEKTVRRSLRRLEHQGLVRVERRPGLVLRVSCGGAA